jgi:type II secretory pathway component PulF
VFRRQPLDHETVMNKEAALRALEEEEQRLQTRIPTTASRMRTRHLHYVVEEEVEAARKHLQALYEAGFELGPALSAVAQSETNAKYAFWLQGIRRHLQMCESFLAEQPSAEGI